MRGLLGSFWVDVVYEDMRDMYIVEMGSSRVRVRLRKPEDCPTPGLQRRFDVTCWSNGCRVMAVGRAQARSWEDEVR